MTDSDRDDLDLLERLGAVEPPSPEVLHRVAANLRGRYLQDATANPGRSITSSRRRSRRAWPVAVAASVVAAGLVVGVAGASHHGRGDRSVASTGSPSAASLREDILTAFSATAPRIAYTRSVWTTDGRATRVVDVWTSPFEGSAGQAQTRREVITLNGRTAQDAEMIYVLPFPDSAVPTDCNGQVDSPKPPPIRAQNTDIEATDGRLIYVDYASRSWSDQPHTCIPLTQLTDASQIRSDIASGGWKVLGHDDIDGQPAVEIDLGGPTQPGAADLLWVDARTFLPVQASASKGGLPGTGESLVTTYRFLSDTAANQKNLTTPIPAGFTRTATPPSAPGA